MKRLFSVIIYLLIISVHVSVAAPRKGDYQFTHVSSADGLSESNVKSILRDSNGFMWFGTKNGLNRYDGSNIRTLECYDSKENRGNNNIGALCEDAKARIWVGTDRGIYVYDPKTDMFSFVGAAAADGTQASNWVQTIKCSSDGAMWALLPDLGIFRFSDEDNVSFYALSSGTERFKETFFSDICIDGSGTVWASTTGDGIYRYDASSDSFKAVETHGPADSHGLHIEKITDGGDGGIIVGTTDGHLFRLLPSQTNRFVPIPFSKAGKVYLRAMEKFDNGLWIGTQQGLFILFPNGSETIIKENLADDSSISDNTIYCIYRDKENGAWIGTMFGGADYHSDRAFRFTNYLTTAELPNRRIRGMAVDPKGRVWIGTESCEMTVFDPSAQTFSRINSLDGYYEPVVNVYSYHGTIYAGFSRIGLYKLDSAGNMERIDRQDGYSDSSVYSYLIDSWGNEWIGMGFALYRRDAGSSTFERVAETGYDWIFALFEASDGAVWIGTMGNGVYRYNPRTLEFKLYTHEEGANSSNGLRSNSISSIMEDSSGNVWLSTDRGGLSRYNSSTDDFTTYGVAEGLPDNVVYKVLEDNRKNLWFGTNRGLVKFNPSSGAVKVFTTADGLPSDQFSYNSALAHPSGEFFFGTVNGIVSFLPDLDELPTPSCPVYFTALNIQHPSGEANEAQALSGNILFADDISIPYDKANFSLSVASPNFGYLGQTAYSYRLLPVSKDWVPLEDNRISFTNLAPGSYNLEVKVDANGQVMSRGLKIVVTPPWWKSSWALAAYLIIFVALAVAWFLWYRNRKERAMKEREENFANNKEKELYRAKVSFFTEIAHEIRTPLSLIDIPLEAMEEMEIENKNVRRYLKIIRQNTSRLLQLTGQLLDFQKIDSRRLTFKYENVNVTELVNSTVDRFEPSITLSGKTLTRDIAPGDIYATLDREAFTKILSNLLNNALKYASSSVRVDLSSSEGQFRVAVTSDGKPIIGDERDNIFEPFYQGENARAGKNGVGIGLPLSRSLAKLLQGSLELAPADASGVNTFVLTLPQNTDAVQHTETADPERQNYLLDEESNQAKTRPEGYTVLLVEDNEGIRSMLAEQLGHSFFVETAQDGAVALERLRNGQADIVVTDIMMPVMDGLELCRHIKEDPELSHVPVVFITAKNDLDSKIKGLRLGAEAYIEKPFSVKYLRQLVTSILDNRRRERESFSKKPLFSVDNMQMNKADEEFMNKVVATINEHISEENFNVEAMTDILCMSRSNLLRKIKSIFNLSPSELIRLVKLKRAAELIREGECRIGEICVMVGINSPSYFSKLFYKQFNITPKDFAKQCQANRAMATDVQASLDNTSVHEN